MRWLSRTILCLLILAAARVHAEPVATLVTVGPGDAVWEKFGHNMIRLQDDERGFDVCYNWGLFDFEQPNFIGNFIRGRMLYTMRAMPTQPLLDEYQGQDRRVTVQRLNLTPDQLNRLVAHCETNRLPGNADYRYDYFRDNCSTRVRDVLDAAVGGALKVATAGQYTSPAVTYRSEAVRMLRDDFWVSLGLDFAAGPATNQPLDRWAEGFLPEKVARDVVFFTGPRSELWPSARPPAPTSPPTRWPMLMAFGVAFASLIAFGRGRWRAGMICLWWAVSGLGGWFLLYMWTLTDHTAAHANQNLWHYSPLAWLALAAWGVRRRPKLRGVLAMAIATVSAMAAASSAGMWLISGETIQPNGGFILLALPINVATAWAVRPSLTKPPAGLEVNG